MDDLIFSARKKRKTLVEDGEDDDLLLTPKKARISQATPFKSHHVTPGSALKSPHSSKSTPALPSEFQHLLSAHTGIEQALSVSLATAQLSPDQDTGRVPSVITHVSIGERGLGVRISVDDLKALCWIWEWDGSTIPNSLTKSISEASVSKSKSKGKTKVKVEEDTSDTEEVILEDPEHNPFIIGENKPKLEEGEDPNPFLASSTPPASPPSKDWTRGGMGLVVSSTMHTTRLDKTSPTKRVPAYGIGIEVEWSQEDVAGGRVGGMAAVARWTAGGAKRKKEMKWRLEKWMELTAKYRGSKPFIPIPLADIPPLPRAPEVSKLAQLVGGTPRKLAFPSPFQTPSKARTPTSVQATPAQDSEGFKIPFPVSGDRPVTPHGPRPVTPSSGGSDVVTPSNGRSGGIRTPSFGKAAAKLKAASKEMLTPTSNGRTTPTPDGRGTPDSGRMDISEPNTPTTMRTSSTALRTPTTSMSTPASGEKSAPETPASARRAALYERIRKKSESEEGSVRKTAVTATVRSASKDSTRPGSTGKMVEKQVVKMVGPEELRRRVILGRLGGIAESVWMLFSASGSTGTIVTNASRKRRALEKSEVVQAVVKSSKVPISAAEAIESLTVLCELCPFFLKSKVIAGEDWLEMPASAGPTAIPSSPAKQPSPSKLPPINFPTPGTPPRRTAALGSPTKSTTPLPGSPTRLTFPVGPPGTPPRRQAINPPSSPTRRQVIEEELLNRSPKRIRKEEGGLRQVREMIRRELEVDEDDPFI